MTGEKTKNKTKQRQRSTDSDDVYRNERNKEGLRVIREFSRPPQRFVVAQPREGPWHWGTTQGLFPPPPPPRPGGAGPPEPECAGGDGGVRTG